MWIISRSILYVFYKIPYKVISEKRQQWHMLMVGRSVTLLLPGQAMYGNCFHNRLLELVESCRVKIEWTNFLDYVYPIIILNGGKKIWKPAACCNGPGLFKKGCNLLRSYILVNVKRSENAITSTPAKLTHYGLLRQMGSQQLQEGLVNRHG